MDWYWKVISREGKRMELECGHERMVVKVPHKTFRATTIYDGSVGPVLDDKTVELLVKGRLPIAH